MADDVEYSDSYRGDDSCSLAKAAHVVAESWTIFILRESLAGVTRFSDYRSRLGIAPDVLTNRLARMVDLGLMERRQYREAGQRARESYHLTERGRQLGLLILALQQWGDDHTPSRVPTTIGFRTTRGDRVDARFVDASGAVVDGDDIRLVRLDPASGEVATVDA